MDIYLDGVAGGSGRPFSAGWLLFLEAGTTFSGYLQQQIGDNQWDIEHVERVHRHPNVREAMTLMSWYVCNHFLKRQYIDSQNLCVLILVSDDSVEPKMSQHIHR